MALNFKDTMDVLLKRGSSVPPPTIEGAIDAIFDGCWTEHQIAGFLIALNMIGISGDMLAVLSRVMRRLAVSKINDDIKSLGRPIGDNCGTGGDGFHTFNISTFSAFIAAAGGLKIAKHGNRSVSSKCGSADLLFKLGFPEDLSLTMSIELLKRFGLTFLFAPKVHPHLKPLMPLRKSLGVPTIFNYVGPLSNPFEPDYQIIGVNKHQLLKPMAEALKGLGIRSGLVIHSQDGLDELSPGSINDCLLIKDQKILPIEIDSSQFGIHGKIDDLKGGDADANLVLTDKLLKLDPETKILSQTICLNAGCLFWISGDVGTLKEGYEKANSLVVSGAVSKFLASWIEYSKKLSQGNQFT